MSAGCCDTPPSVDDAEPGWRVALWIALGVNAAMFIAELVAGLASGSVSLRADALDFLGDSASYAISLIVVGLAMRWRSRAALLKGVTLVGFGVWVFASAGIAVAHSVAPEPKVMGGIGFCALVANAGVALLLYRYRSGDANMRSVWVCSRNDVLGNIAVMLAALGVFGTGSVWPDVVVATVMSALAFWGGVQIIRTAMRELQHAGATP